MPARLQVVRDELESGSGSDHGIKLRNLPGGEKMRGRLNLSKITMSSMIAAHRQERSQRVALEQMAKRRWMRYPMLIFRRWRERRALSKLIFMAPTSPEEASSKLAYLMATMIVDRSPSSSEELVQLINTLRPYRERLVPFLKK